MKNLHDPNWNSSLENSSDHWTFLSSHQWQCQIKWTRLFAYWQYVTKWWVVPNKLENYLIFSITCAFISRPQKKTCQNSLSDEFINWLFSCWSCHSADASIISIVENRWVSMIWWNRLDKTWWLRIMNSSWQKLTDQCALEFSWLKYESCQCRPLRMANYSQRCSIRSIL